MLTLMNHWNAVWHSNLAGIETYLRGHSKAEREAFDRQLRRPPSPLWPQHRFLRYAPPGPPANR